MLAKRLANVVSLTNFHLKTTWHAYVGPMLDQRNAFNMKHNQIMFLKQVAGVYWVNVVFSTNVLDIVLFHTCVEQNVGQTLG